MRSNQVNEEEIENSEQVDENWDESGEVERILYKEAKEYYEKVWSLFNGIEEKANRMLTRDFTFISLIFVGITFLASQEFYDIFWINWY